MRMSMHLKAYEIDGTLLRTGSANSSTSGENAQERPYRSWVHPHPRRPCSGRSPDYLSLRAAARMSAKGVSEPMTLYRIVRASGGGRRGGRLLTPLVGREEARPARPALGARTQGRGSARAHRWRAGLGQVAADRGVSRPPRRDAAYLGRVVVVTDIPAGREASRSRLAPASARPRSFRRLLVTSVQRRAPAQCAAPNSLSPRQQRRRRRQWLWRRSGRRSAAAAPIARSRARPPVWFVLDESRGDPPGHQFAFSAGFAGCTPAELRFSTGGPFRAVLYLETPCLPILRLAVFVGGT